MRQKKQYVICRGIWGVSKGTRFCHRLCRVPPTAAKTGKRVGMFDNFITGPHDLKVMATKYLFSLS
ncbi:MAG: hypothetical protein QME74_08780, partial [Candidatus Edwardsbacteria bacterium]|nr:hypothetical protein [Candidatus Edwardsbacteria bacterium]